MNSRRSLQRIIPNRRWPYFESDPCPSSSTLALASINASVSHHAHKTSWQVPCANGSLATQARLLATSHPVCATPSTAIAANMADLNSATGLRRVDMNNGFWFHFPCFESSSWRRCLLVLFCCWRQTFTFCFWTPWVNANSSSEPTAQADSNSFCSCSIDYCASWIQNQTFSSCLGLRWFCFCRFGRRRSPTCYDLATVLYSLGIGGSLKALT